MGEVELIVKRRRRTVIFVDGGECLAREVRIAVPSSPAPRTSMLFAAILGSGLKWRRR